MSIEVENIIRSKRRTISLHITDVGELVVRAPIRTKDSEIFSIVEKHQKWIQKKKILVSKYNKIIKFADGQEFYYLGRLYPLFISEDSMFPFIFSGNNFFISKKHIEKAKDLFINWYKSEAKKIISERVEFFAGIMGEKYLKIRINSAKTRWASCSINSTLTFSWRLAMAPMEVIDYVVVHELSHIKHKNHKKRFYNRVGKYMPDYKRVRSYLRKNGHLLSFNT